MKRFTAFVMNIVDRFQTDHVTLYSAQAAYFVVVSVIPFALILVSLIQIFVPDNIETLIDTVVMVLPGTLGDKAAQLIYSMFHYARSTISLSVILTLWAASRGIMGLQDGLHTIYHVKNRGNYFVRRFKCILYTFVFIIAIILALVLLVLGNNLQELMAENLTFLGQVVKVILAFRLLLTLAVFIIAFTFAYRFLTGLKYPFLDALPGVLVATLGWVIFSSIFSVYMTNFSMYTVYGSMGAIILLFLWIYFCILILMVGAELNVYIAERRGDLSEDEE